MRVLQVSTVVAPPLIGGAERTLLSIEEELVAAGHDVHLVGLLPRGVPPVREGRLTQHPIPNVYWPFGDVQRPVLAKAAWHALDLYNRRATALLDSTVQQTRPDVLLVHNLRGWAFAPWLVAQRHQLRLVQVLHDYGCLCVSSDLWHGGRGCEASPPCRARAAVARRTWPGGDVVGVSRATLDRHLEAGLFAGSPTHVVYPIRPTAAPAAEGAQQKPRRFGYLGRLDPTKGIDVLLGAAQRARVPLLVAGSGASRDLARWESDYPGVAEWLGWMAPEELFSKIDVLVVPSVWEEPFGRVVVEAAAHGLPVLVSARGGLVEAARVASARFATFEPTVDSLAEAMLAADFVVDPLPAGPSMADVLAEPREKA